MRAQTASVRRSFAQVNGVVGQVLAAAVIVVEHADAVQARGRGQGQFAGGRLEGDPAGRADRCEAPAAVAAVTGPGDGLGGLDVVDQHIAVGVRRGVDRLAAVQAREIAATAGAVVVGGHDEVGRGVDGLAFVAQVLDAAALGLGHVDLVADVGRGGHVEVVAGVAAHQGLVGGQGRVDAVEAGGGGFEPGLDVAALHPHGVHGVGVQVQVGRVVDGHVAAG